MTHLSWDLHLHAGPSVTPRWGDGLRVWEAARDAGVRGFVWKSHEEHTAMRCQMLPQPPPLGIGSASLNSWATVESVIAAVHDGARWIWGPSRDPRGELGWDLELPSWWSQLKVELAHLPHPVALATAHLGAQGRLELARCGAEIPGVHCSVTHSLYLLPNEATALAEYGCAFEFDLYTSVHPIPGRPGGDIVELAERLLEGGSLVYLTSDAGQAQVGNPFEFSSRELSKLAGRRTDGLVAELAVTNPARFVRQVLPAEVYQ
jgi:hypothetical protein